MVERLRALEERFISEIESHPHAATSLVLQNLEALARIRQLRADYEEDELVTLLLESDGVPEECFAKTDLGSCEHGFDCVCDECSIILGEDVTHLARPN